MKEFTSQDFQKWRDLNQRGFSLYILRKSLKNYHRKFIKEDLTN